MKEKKKKMIVKMELITYFLIYLDSLRIWSLSGEKTEEEKTEFLKEKYKKFGSIITFQEFSDLFYFKNMISGIFVFYYIKEYISNNDIDINDEILIKTFEKAIEENTSIEKDKEHTEYVKKFLLTFICRIEETISENNTIKNSIVSTLAIAFIQTKMSYIIGDESKEHEEKMIFILNNFREDYSIIYELLDEEFNGTELIV